MVTLVVVAVVIIAVIVVGILVTKSPSYTARGDPPARGDRRLTRSMAGLGLPLPRLGLQPAHRHHRRPRERRRGLRHHPQLGHHAALRRAGARHLALERGRQGHRPSPRPAANVADTLVPNPDPDSYPSGHVCFAIALGFAILVLVARSRVRVLVAILAIILALVTSASRVYLAIHYPTDVVASIVFAAAAFIGSRRCGRGIRRESSA
ncbi:MAG: phosphatase PAP2 family protein [Galbitalea sp.]